jgi:tRNA-dihydrouridine synthase 1
LQEDWDLVYKLVNKLHKNLDVPVTAKIRILETKEKTLEYAKVLLSAGASILTVHGRRREQKGHKSGVADWSYIRYLRDNLPPETVIFANGNILRHKDIFRCLQETGADAVMSAEGNLYDPTIFAAPPPYDPENREYWWDRYGKGGYRMDAVFRRYMSIIYKYVLEEAEPERKPLFIPSDGPLEELLPELPETEQPPRKRQKKGPSKEARTVNITSIQAHLFHFLRPLVSVHTNVRDVLAKAPLGDMKAFEKVLSLTERAVAQGLVDYAADPDKFHDKDTVATDEDEEDIVDEESSAKAIRACKKPWWVCQAHVRPMPKEALELGRLSLTKKEKKALEEAQKAQIKATSVTNGSGNDRNDEAGPEKTTIPAQAAQIKASSETNGLGSDRTDKAVPDETTSTVPAQAVYG